MARFCAFCKKDSETGLKIDRKKHKAKPRGICNECKKLRFGRLRLVKMDPIMTDASNNYFICKCECGRFKSISLHHLKRKTGTKSCGCIIKNRDGKKNQNIYLTGYAANRAGKTGALVVLLLYIKQGRPHEHEKRPVTQIPVFTFTGSSQQSPQRSEGVSV